MNSRSYVRWTGSSLITLGVIYVGLIGWGIITQDPETGSIQDPVRIWMEIATMISALILLFFALSIQCMLGPKPNFLSEISVVCMSILVALTSAVHFVSITVSEQIVKAAPLLSPLLTLNWPSLLLSIDILAWDVFFGIAFIFLGLALRPLKELRIAQSLMIVSGALSLLGLIALPLNNMDLRFIGIFGYTVMPVISCLFLLNRIKKTP